MGIRFLKKNLNRIQKNAFLVGFFSLVWFLLRTGTKPSRAVYPCQKAAAANSYLWLTAYVLPFLLAIPQKIAKTVLGGRKLIIVTVMLVIVAVGSIVFWEVQRSLKPEEEVIGLPLEGHLAISEPSSDIFVVNGTTGYDGGFNVLISLMGEHGLLFYKSNTSGLNQGPEGLITRDDVILIKVNSQWNARGGTNTDLLKTIIEAIINHPDGFVGEIIVADNGQDQYGSLNSGGSLDWSYSNAEDHSQSVQKVVDMFADSHKVSTYLWDEIAQNGVDEYSEGDMEDGYVVNQTANSVTGIKVSYPKFKTKFGTYVSFKKGIWDPETESYDSEKLKVINVPVLKSHSTYGVTACVKHYMGVVSDKLTDHNPHNHVGTGGMGTVMVETRMPILNILDAIWINAVPSGGPSTSYSEATRVNVIMASTDPVALDYWAAKYVLMQAARLKGYTNLSSMDPEDGYFGQWLKLSMEEMQKVGYQVTMTEDNMNVYVVNMPQES